MSCLFESLGKYVNLNDVDTRQLIVGYLSNNPMLIDDMSAKDLIKISYGISLEKYIEKMLKNYTWGSAIEIKAFADLFNINVNVYMYTINRDLELFSSPSNKNIIDFHAKNGGNRTINLVYLNNNHYFVPK
jgi:hypothetical protein